MFFLYVLLNYSSYYDQTLVSCSEYAREVSWPTIIYLYLFNFTWHWHCNACMYGTIRMLQK